MEILVREQLLDLRDDLDNRARLVVLLDDRLDQVLVRVDVVEELPAPAVVEAVVRLLRRCVAQLPDVLPHPLLLALQQPFPRVERFTRRLERLLSDFLHYLHERLLELAVWYHLINCVVGISRALFFINASEYCGLKIRSTVCDGQSTLQLLAVRSKKITWLCPSHVTF